MNAKSIKTESVKNFILSFRHTGIVIILVIMMLAGCRSKTPPVTFYTLSPMQEAALSKDPRSGKDISIGVGPLRLPDYLNKPQIVTRKGVSKLDYSEFHRWGGYLDKGFLRVVSENLSVLLSTDQVKIFPWSRKHEPLFQVDFDVKQFDGQLGEVVTLNIIWTIRGREKGAKPLIAKRSVIQQPVSGHNHDALVLAYSQALGELSQEIASIIESISKGKRQHEN
jgi:uncharacterized lipoprotein YmbA